MDEILTIEQCILLPDPRIGYDIVARSDGFDSLWEEPALRMAAQLGKGSFPLTPNPSPPGERGELESLFVRPFARGWITVVRVSQGRFHFLILTQRLYDGLGDPFLLTERFPTQWALRGFLPTLHWPADEVPQRNVDELHAMLSDSGDDMSLLLGGTQALVDGSRLIIVSEVPRPDLVYAIWQLLPTRTRNELYPATFAMSNDLDFHFVVLPQAPEPWPMGYLSEEQAHDYPQGRYELNLQIAIESKDQHAVDQLFNRRTSSETLRLALWLVLGAFVIAAVSKLLG